jgi:3-oxoacyl-[acyl-carrier-protein] synthase I
MRRVVVTGIGIVSSIGNNAEEVATSLREARSGVVAAPEYTELGFRSQVHAPVKLDWEPLVDRRAARFLAPGLAYARISADQAIADAGLTPDEISNEATGLIVGAGGTSTHTIVNAAETARTKGPKRVGPFAVPKTMSSGPSATLCTELKIKGINYSISSACATSAHCIGASYEQIIMGKQDRMIAGGCEELDWSTSVLFDAMGAMSSDFNDRPSVASRAYDIDRDGFVIAGGGGVVILEELEVARARGAKIYGEIVGYAATSDGYDMVAPDGLGATRCMNLALKGVNRTVQYLNPHGTSTPVGDLKEMEAVRAVFGDKIPLIASTKSLTGHSLGAAGAQEAIYCLLMMRDGFACESAHIENLDPAFADMPILRERRDMALDCVMSNSFGFGGTNASLVMAKVD